MSARRPRGFAISGYASKAAKKGHALGPPYCREWTREEAKAASRKAARQRDTAGRFRSQTDPLPEPASGRADEKNKLAEKLAIEPPPWAGTRSPQRRAEQGDA
jgi:hypothetical protein